MSLIDFQCFFGARGDALSVRPPDLALAAQYATDVAAEMLLFAGEEATTDLAGGNAKLNEALKTDARFRGWLGLSVHQPDLSQELARKYLTRASWIGARFDQKTENDAVTTAGGYVVLNALRRYGRLVLLTVNSPATLAAAISAARDFYSLKFIVAPQNELMTSDSLPAIRESVNISWMASAAFAERDVVAHAIEVLGEKRVVWGSEWGRLHPAAALGMINESGISEFQRERIVLRNPRDLLSFDE